MIDFIKLELNNTIPTIIEDLKNNKLLEFKAIVNIKTGELYPYLFAEYKNLKFKIYESTDANPIERITIEGSLHKYFNNGKHNFNTFTIEDINKVLPELEDKFDIKPVNCLIKQLELGVNIIPPIPSKTVLNNSFSHKTKQFKWVPVKDEGEYIQVIHQRHVIKFYNKAKHYRSKGYDIKTEILRFEIKFLKMYSLNQLGIFNLADLLNYGLHNFVDLLVKEWNNILYYDSTIIDGTLDELKYSNPNFWNKLNSNKLKYHRNKLNKLINDNPKNIKNKIEKIIREVAVYITTKNAKINPLNILLNKSVLVSKTFYPNETVYLIDFREKRFFIIPKENNYRFINYEKQNIMKLKFKMVCQNQK